MNRWALVGLILLALGAAGTGTAVVYNMKRGIRNKNPFNIRISSSNWRGKVPLQLNTDGSFEQFESALSGIRAGIKVLMTYKNKYGIKTVRGIINKFAPPVENNTDSYIKHVSEKLGVTPDQIIDIEQHLPELAKSIIKHENGINPYSDKEIVDAIEAAYA